jgi:hypothetical protein
MHKRTDRGMVAVTGMGWGIILSDGRIWEKNNNRIGRVKSLTLDIGTNRLWNTT